MPFNFTVETLRNGSSVAQLGVLPRTTGSGALGINDTGEVVGYSYRVGGLALATWGTGT